MLTATFNQDRFPERLSVPTQSPNPESADPRGQRDGLQGGQQTFAILCKTEGGWQELVWSSGNVHFIALIRLSVVRSVNFCSKKYNCIGLDCVDSSGGI